MSWQVCLCSRKAPLVRIRGLCRVGFNGIMKTRLTPYYINLVYDTCLKSFWRKKALSKFLRQAGVAEALSTVGARKRAKRIFWTGCLLITRDQNHTEIVLAIGVRLDTENQRVLDFGRSADGSHKGDWPVFILSQPFPDGGAAVKLYMFEVCPHALPFTVNQ